MISGLKIGPFSLIIYGIAAGYLAVSEHLPGNIVSAVQAKDQQEHDLPNFHRVEPFLYRGGQPRGKGLERLQQMGIKTVINLRGGKQPLKEQSECNKLGLKFISIPISHHHAPANSDVEQFLQIVQAAKDDPSKGGVFVHCKAGEDRTGCMIALYRVKEDGWTSRQACDEMQKLGFHSIFRELTKSVKQAEQDKTQSTTKAEDK